MASAAEGIASKATEAKMGKALISWLLPRLRYRLSSVFMASFACCHSSEAIHRLSNPRLDRHCCSAEVAVSQGSTIGSRLT